ncbi:Amino acid-binding ACT domain-containing protein [Flavobacterium sp. 9AF]|uniref:amino acid-binding ACT domain-containing protein n=1 Tax=Flavobacterium sp. 9AF TaxID=2653142 RepID=UPI0012F33ACD|nr:amino acid-binding ACT domain-containing protein [Flavobacterium sp. 9AF]VXB59653.1 Amino acid-binding ACT domain-containing protein [Flavobacterium sp. 9AF]
MKDIEIILENKIGQLALLGETLGKHKISLEGGGVFTYKNVAVAHFLVEDAEKAKQVLKEVGINLIKINEVIIQKLRQDVPGQLGQFCKRLAEENISILVQYSDHSNQLIIVPDHLEKAKQVSKLWMQEWWTY